MSFFDGELDWLERQMASSSLDGLGLLDPLAEVDTSAYETHTERWERIQFERGAPLRLKKLKAILKKSPPGFMRRWLSRYQRKRLRHLRQMAIGWR